MYLNETNKKKIYLHFYEFSLCNINFIYILKIKLIIKLIRIKIKNIEKVPINFKEFKNISNKGKKMKNK